MLRSPLFKYTAGAALLAGAIGLTAAVLVPPPANSAYSTDPIVTENLDASADALRVVGIVSCYLRNMAPEKAYDLQGNERYLALIDVNLCDSGSNQSANEGSAKAYETAVVEPSFDAETGNLNIKAWMSLNEDGVTYHTWVNATISGGAAQFPPYGRWSVNWCEKLSTAAASDPCRSLGVASVSEQGMSAYVYGKSDQWENEQAVFGNLSADFLSGGGKFTRVEKALLNNQIVQDSSGFYSFEPGFFYTDQTVLDNGNQVNAKQCMIPDSTAAGALVSAWETSLYDTQTGALFDINAGLSVRTNPSSSSEPIMWGWAGQWGVRFPDRQARNGEELLGFAMGSNVAQNFTAFSSPGNLYKHTGSLENLSAIDGIPLFGNAPRSLFNVANNGMLDQLDVVMVWDQAASAFRVLSYTYEASGAQWQTVMPPSNSPLTFDLATLATAFQGTEFSLRQEGENTQYRIFTNTAKVQIRSQTTVQLGESVPSQLLCVGNCVVNSSLTVNMVTGNLAQLQTHAVTWDAQAHIVKYQGVDIDFSGSQSNGPSGYLVAADSVAVFECNNTPSTYCDQVNSTVTNYTYYQWDTGRNDYQRYTALVDANGDLVEFDPSISVIYNVPANDTRAGSYAGTSVRMQYAGAGQLWWPGFCYNPATRERNNCEPGSQYANHFSVPFDHTVGLVTTGNNQSYLVKTTRRGVLYPTTNLANCSASLQTRAAEFGQATLPSRADWVNPANPSSPNYIGPWPATPDQTLVIDGQIQTGAVQ